MPPAQRPNRAPPRPPSAPFDHPPSSQVNTAFADGMCKISEQLEGGQTLQKACANLFAKHERVIFCGNGYSAEWPIE